MHILTEENLNDRAKHDSIYQELLQQCISAEEKYCKILSNLSPEDQDALSHYISLCEELEYRRIALVLEMLQ